jgi:adenylate kinase family enzyme
VQLPQRIHIVGASGSGVTTLAAEVAARDGRRHLDTDDYYWMPTHPPYREKRAVADRLALLRDAIRESPAWVLSGSLCGWGDPLIPEFELVVFLVVPAAIRLARLEAREVERYGVEAIAPGGTHHDHYREFVEWSERYDGAGLEQRSRALHEAWLAALPCPVLRLEGDLSLDERLARMKAWRR